LDDCSCFVPLRTNFGGRENAVISTHPAEPKAYLNWKLIIFKEKAIQLFCSSQIAADQAQNVRAAKMVRRRLTVVTGPVNQRVSLGVVDNVIKTFYKTLFLHACAEM